MAVHTIGTGGDYTSITAWEAALPATLLEDEIGELFAEDFREGRITINGSTTAADKRVILRAATGARHNGTAGSGARIYDNFGGTWGIINTYVGHFRIEGVELYSDGLANTNAFYTPTTASQVLEVEGCLIHDMSSVTNGVQGSAVFRNCAGWGFSNNGLLGRSSSPESILVENCTFIKSATYSANSTAGIRYATAKNCYAANFGGLNGYANYLQIAAGSSNNAASDASGSSAGLDNLDPALQFQSVGGTWNLKLLSTSALIGAGTPIAGLTTDFEGDTRDATAPDIGFDEYVAAGGGSYAETISETVTASDVILALASVAASLTESAVLADSATNAAAIAAALSEAVAASDALTTSASYAAALSEVLTLADAAINGNTYAVALSESLTLSDAVAQAVVFAPTIAEALSIAESLASQADYAGTLAEVVSMADALTADGGANIAFLGRVFVSTALPDTFTSTALPERWEAVAVPQRWTSTAR